MLFHIQKSLILLWHHLHIRVGLVYLDTFNSTSEVLNSYIIEEKERSRRRLSVIVHNVAESSAESGSEKIHDISNVASIFDKYVWVKVNVTDANRIGRRKDDPRLIKVSVESEHDKAMLLYNCTKLRARDNPEDIQKVYITPDLTPREQQHNKDLRIQLAEKNKSGKKYFIKNGRIVQRGG